ncbi:MAG: SycD/LcrH family type III secretion system chaperone [Parachlamydiaceae bacterium]|nr:SycD/LcrH family type III secretion system chaperone [Parachlamydiaceae bacterium]
MASNIESNKIDKKNFDIREAIKNTASKMGKDVPVEEKKEHAKVLIKIFEKKMTPMQAMNISEEEISVIYSYAYQLFNTGKYAEACELFKMLYVLNPGQEGFATSLGACYHKMEDYETASLMYLIDAQLNPFDPVSAFYCYDCFMHMNNPEGAYIMLDVVVKRADGQPQFEKIQDKAEALLDGFDRSTLTELNTLMGFSNTGDDKPMNISSSQST